MVVLGSSGSPEGALAAQCVRRKRRRAIGEGLGAAATLPPSADVVPYPMSPAATGVRGRAFRQLEASLPVVGRERGRRPF